jgi:hypothetical protein
MLKFDSIRKTSKSVAPIRRNSTLSQTIRTPYIASFRGPILLSAPHSSKLQRGGALTSSKERIHLREQWVSTLIFKLAIEIENI